MSELPPEPTRPEIREPESFPEIENLPAPPAPTVEFQYRPEQFVCVRCGSRNLTRGMIVDYGEKFEQVRFAPRRLSLAWLNSLFNLRPWRALARLDAVACRDCGAVLLTVDPAELRRAERIRED